jgi:hypothetical protein
MFDALTRSERAILRSILCNARRNVWQLRTNKRAAYELAAELGGMIRDL